jgi:hypothetical protein
MTIFEYAICNYASQLMREDEREIAVELARHADDGDVDAAGALREYSLEIISKRAPQRARLEIERAANGRRM